MVQTIAGRLKAVQFFFNVMDLFLLFLQLQMTMCPSTLLDRDSYPHLPWPQIKAANWGCHETRVSFATTIPTRSDVTNNIHIIYLNS